MSAPELTLDSHKEQLAKGWSYLLGAMDLHAALAPRVAHCAVLQVRGTARQAYWKDERDRIDSQGNYRVLQLWCAPKYSGRDSQLAEAQTLEAVLTGVPRTALRRGVASKPHVLTLLTECLAAVAPRGIFVGKHPDNGWHLSIGLDANLGTLEAALQSMHLGQYTVKRVRPMVPPGASLPDSGPALPRHRA